MNELVVPPAPHWYKSTMMACSPDNTLVYGSKNDIVVLKEQTPVDPVNVQFIYSAHSKHIVSVSLNTKWKQPHSYVASLGEENIIIIWDLDTFKKKTSNKDHTEHKESVIGAVFAGDDRVVSASSTGFVIVWNINTNESRQLKDLFKKKVTLTCLSSCPHAGWLLAFGLSTGNVVIADLRRDGQVLYNLRGHYQSVVSLSWCPAPINIFPTNPKNTVKNKSREVEITKEKVNPWVNLVHADDNETPAEQEPLKAQVEDFLQECDNLKKKILNLEPSMKESKHEKESHNENLRDGRSPVLEREVGDCLVSSKKNKKQNGEKQFEECNPSSRPLPVLFDPSDDNFLDEQDFFDKIDDAEKTAPLARDSPEKVESSEKTVDQAMVNPVPNTVTSPGSSSDVSVEDKGNKQEEEDTKNFVVVEESNETDKTGNPDADNFIVQKHNNEDTNPKDKDHETEEKDKDESKESQSEDSGVVNEASPKIEEIIEEEPRTEFLLASAGKDKSIYIWRAGTDGRMQSFFYVSKKENRKDRNVNSWISLCWIAPSVLLTSSPKGEILLWPLPKPKDPNQQRKVVHIEHSSLVFNIVAPPKYSTPYNWRDEDDLPFWSFGQDGKLLNFDIKHSKINFSFSTVTSMVTCFDSSALDPNRLGIGLRDGGVQVWDLSLPHTKIIKMQRFHQKATHKICAISWHPLKEMVVGFGTEEGRVGFVDLTTRKTNLFPHYFRNQVYKVQWGPIESDTNNLGLYVVSEGKMAIYDTKNMNEDPVLLDVPGKLHIHKFAWKPDFSLLLLNGNDGSLIILKTNLATVTTFYPSEKGLNVITWHPDAFTNQTDISPRCYWFAATTTKGVLVFDCKSIEENDENFSERIVALFEGHLRPPLGLAWCPFQGDRIVSTAADGLAHVWDVTTKTVVATFVDSYFAHNPAVVWSPVNADLIIMGDRILRIWSISKNPPKTDEEFLATRKRQLAKTSKNDVEKIEKKNKVAVICPKPNKSKSLIVPIMYVSNDQNISSQVETMKKIMNGDVSLVDDEVDPLQIFGNKKEISQLLEANYDQKQKDGNFKSCELISLWKGNLGEYIRSAIDENRVTPTIISLAPMVSLSIWQEACVTYAKKLSEDQNSDPLEAAMYYLACHKVEEALNCLILNSLFKEALALAKYRLPKGSELITKVTEKWAEYSILTGNFENAALCYLSVKQYENAAKVLARRNHQEFLEFAKELALKVDNLGLYESIKFKCNKIENGDTDVDQCGNTSSRIEEILMGEEGKSSVSSLLEEESETTTKTENDLPQEKSNCQKMLQNSKTDIE